MTLGKAVMVVFVGAQPQLLLTLKLVHALQSFHPRDAVII